MHFTAYQVVYIQSGSTRLYAELIQTMTERDSCWLRPWCLEIEASQAQPAILIDLRDGPDLICPTPCIQPALDTEWLELLEKLGNVKEVCSYSQANQHLRRFLQATFSKKDFPNDETLAQ